MKIAFWSNVHGQTGTTSNAIAISLMAALKHQHVALLQSHFTLNNLSQPLIGMEISPDTFRDTGIDALIRDLKSGPLSREVVFTDGISVPSLRHRYNLYVGTGKKNEADYEREMVLAHGPVFEAVERYHDYVFIDVRSGYRGEVSQSILQGVDVVAVCLDQNTHVIDSYFKDPVQADNVFYIIGNYDENSRYNLSNLSKRYPQLKKRTGAIYHNSDYMDAQNDGQAVQFFLKNYLCSEDSSNYDFMRSVHSCMGLLGVRGREGA